MNGFEFANIWIYIVGCFGGGALAALVFNLNNPQEKLPVTGPADKIS
jgi:hypothetical protein